MTTIKNLWINYKDVIYIVTIILLILLSYTECERGNVSLAEKQALEVAMADTIHHYVDKEGKNHARISVLETQSVRDFLNIQTKDKEIISLQKTVKEYKSKLGKQGSVTNFTSESNYEEKSKTTDKVYTEKDTLPKGSFIALPYTFSNRDTTWLQFRFNIDKDSTYYSIKTKDAYSVVIGEERPGWFKKPVPFVDVKNDNPHSKVQTLRAYQVKDNRKARNFHLGIGTFYGLGVKDGIISTGFFVGGGLMWAPISF